MVKTNERKRKSDQEKFDHEQIKKENRVDVEDSDDNLTMKTIYHTSYQDDIASSFCLQSSDNLLTLKTKGNLEVLRLENQREFHQSHLQLSSKTLPCSTYNVIETLKINEKQIFKSMSHKQKNDAMLNNYLFPSCLPKKPSLVKCLISTCNQSSKPVIAALNSSGSLELSTYLKDSDTNELAMKNFAELCEIQKNNFKHENYTKYEKLQKVVDDLMFYDFSWCPEIIGSNRFIAALTRSRLLVIFSVSPGNEVALSFSEQLEKSINILKWVKQSDGHVLLVNGEKGALGKYLINFDANTKIAGVKKVGETPGKLKILISELEWSAADSSVIVAVKAHSIEVFSGSQSIVQYVGLSVSGVTSVSSTSPEFLISTLDNEIYFLKLSNSNGNLTIADFNRVAVINTQLNQSKFRAYGIATSKNSVLVYMALHPETANDHLTMKQPLCLTVHRFSLKNPYEILLQNQSLRLTDYHDCVEAVRFIGTSNIESMVTLTTMDYDLGLTRDFAYYLKIQLLVTKAKLVFYKSRSENIHDVTNETKMSIEKIIEVINAYEILKNFDGTKNLSAPCLVSIRCLANFVESYVSEVIEKPPFNMAQAVFKEELIEVLTRIRANPSLKDVKEELCYYCDGVIASDKLTCADNHQPVRCPMTKLQLNIATMNVCSRCNCSVMDLDTLKAITGSSEVFCIYCDEFLQNL